jgi:hypothetical protein
MAIEYKKIVKPKVDATTNEVYQWVFGLNGTCTDSGETGHINTVHTITDDVKKHYNQWSKSEIDTLYDACDVKCGFQNAVDKIITARKGKKVEPEDFDYNSLV